MAHVITLYIERSAYDLKRWKGLLDQAKIREDRHVDKTFGLVDDDDTLIATGSISRNILKCLAVLPEHQGGAVLGTLMSFLTQEVQDAGYQACYIYTKPCLASSFRYLGFEEIAHINNQIALLEKAVFGIESYVEGLRAHRKSNASRVGAIVMNANPFTKGHQYLVQQAALACDHLFVFVVSEDVSAFPHAVRKRLVQEGLKDLKNVSVLDTGAYMVSSATFPSYFLPEDEDLTRLQARLDATIFLNYMVAALNITDRYLGEEPLSVTTNYYNEALQEVLEPRVFVHILERKQDQTAVISATRVREAFLQGNMSELYDLVPETTYEFLISNEGLKLRDELLRGGNENGSV